MENYFFDINEEFLEKKVFILIIYDISDNNTRVKFAKYLSGYGVRVQKSAFEASITKTKYKKLLAGIPTFLKDKDDSIKIYQIQGKGQVLSWGKKQQDIQEEVIVL